MSEDNIEDINTSQSEENDLCFNILSTIYSKSLKVADELDIKEIRSKYNEDQEKSFDSQFNEFAEENSGVDFNTDGVDYQLVDTAVGMLEDGGNKEYNSNWIKIEGDENLHEEEKAKSESENEDKLKDNGEIKRENKNDIIDTSSTEKSNIIKIDENLNEQKKNLIPEAPPIKPLLLK